MLYPSQYPTWLEIDLSAVAHNTRAVINKAGVDLMAVVKANAYGFGAIDIAHTVLNNGASSLAVARCSEALSLRHAGIQAPILVFGMATPTEVDEAIAERVSLTLHSFESAQLYAERARAAGNVVHVHLKVDTGFGRLGVLPDDALSLAQTALASGVIQFDGLYSHLAMADEAPDHPITQAQMDRFEGVRNAFVSAGINPAWVHLANSAAAFGIPQSRYNLVRVGTALLGMKPFYFQSLPPELHRALSWKAQLAASKQLPPGSGVGYGHTYITQDSEWVGVVPVGYGDGFRRKRGNVVLIQGQRCEVIGRVSGDSCIVRLPGYVAPGSEVVIIGKQGEEEITTDELITRWDISQADITSGINLRVPRLYLD